uniref:Uncharacterized protein n=1 Tax=Arundo donax TaxID=35708 RepID=A0A0A9FNH7_ARUDO
MLKYATFHISIGLISPRFAYTLGLQINYSTSHLSVLHVLLIN